MAADTGRVEVDGADTFARTLGTASDGLDELDGAADATGQLIRTRAAARAPKVSGQLARSLFVDASGSTVSVVSDLVYAGPIHYGWAAHHISAQPFLVPAAIDSEPIWLGYYERDAQAKLDKVRGA